MKVAKSVINITIIFLAVVSLFVAGVWVYVNIWGKSLIPTSVNSTYATSVTNPLTGEVLPTLQASYYANKNGSGCEVVELRINAYSGVSRQALFPRGFQMVWDKNGNIVPYKDSTGAVSSVWFYDYDSTGDYSFVSGHIYELGKYDSASGAVVGGDPFIVDIDGKPYGLKLDGTYPISHHELDGWKVARSCGFLGLNLLWEGTNFYKDYTTIHTYTFSDLLLRVRDIIKSCSAGTGDYTINLVDLGGFLHIYELDDNGNCKGSPIGAGGTINTFFSAQCHYDRRGMSWTKQSLFGSVAGDKEYNLTGIDENVDYWKATNTYHINEQAFESRYSQVDNGFYYVLPTATINELKDYEDMEINIVFDVSNLTNINVVGFDYYALQGIKVKSLTIKSKTQRNFQLLVGSLRDTGLTSADIHLENITLINTNSGVEL